MSMWEQPKDQLPSCAHFAADSLLGLCSPVFTRVQSCPLILLSLESCSVSVGSPLGWQRGRGDLGSSVLGTTCLTLHY